jgi:hypothetical protein
LAEKPRKTGVPPEKVVHQRKKLRKVKDFARAP